MNFVPTKLIGSYFCSLKHDALRIVGVCGFVLFCGLANRSVAEPYDTNGAQLPSTTNIGTNGQGWGNPALCTMYVGWWGALNFNSPGSFTVYANVFFTGGSPYSYVRYVQYSVDDGPRVTVFNNPGGGWGGWSREVGEWRVFPITIAQQSGTHSVKVFSANGFTGGEAICTFSYADNSNIAPTVAFSLPPPPVIYPGDRFAVRATASDGNGNVGGVWVKYSVNGGELQLLSQDPYLPITNNPTTVTSNENYVTAGPVGSTYQFRCGAWDQSGAYAVEVATSVIVVSNRIPSVTLAAAGLGSVNGGQEITVSSENGSAITFTSSASDPDGNYARTRTWVNYNGQGWLTLRDDANASYSWSFTLNGLGTYQFCSRSVDAYGSESESAIINVTSTDRAPVLSLATSPSSILFGQTTTITSTASDQDGNLAFHGVLALAQDGSTWYRSLNTDHSTGWGNHPVSNDFVSANYTDGYAVTSGALDTREVVYRPSWTGSTTFHSNAHDNYLWQSSSHAAVYAAVSVAKATPNITGWGDQSRTGSGAFAGAFNVSLSNPYSGAVAVPTGSLTFSIVDVSGSAASPTSGAVGSGTTFKPGNYVVRCTYPGDGNYNGCSWDRDFIVGNVPSVVSITADGVGTKTIYYGQAATIATTGTDADGNLYNVDWMRYDGGYYRPGNADMSRIGWNGWPADGPYYSSQNFTNDVVSGAGPVTKSAVFHPPGVGTYNFLGYAGDAWGNWGAWAYVVVNPAPLTITASSHTRSYGTANPAFSASYSGLVNGESSAVVTGLTLTSGASEGSAPGIYPITPANGSAAHYAITYVPGVLTISKANQAITFPELGDGTYGINKNVSASSSSGLPVVLTVVSGPATISNGTLFFSSTGEVKVRASQGGNGNFNAAPNVDRIFTVNKASQTINFATPSAGTYGVDKTLSATASSGLGVSFNVLSGPATVSGSMLTFTGAGTVAVRASQPGNGNYSAAANVDRSFAVNKASQTISFATPSAGTYDTPKTLSATASSGLGVSFSVISGPATIAGSTLTFTGVGTVAVRASQPGNADFNAASDVDQTFAVGKAPATVTIGAWTPHATYDDSPKVPSVTTTPTGLTFEVTYNGSSTAPIDAGNYNVAVTIIDDKYFGSASTTLTIDPMPVNVSLGDTNFIYDGESKMVQIYYAAGLSGIAFDSAAAAAAATITGTTSATNPHEGGYSFTVSLSGNYIGGSALPFFWAIGCCPAEVIFDDMDMVYTYDGTAKVPTFTTNPGNLDVGYNFLKLGESTNVPVPEAIDAGFYKVTVTVLDSPPLDDPSKVYVGSGSVDLTIAKADQNALTIVASPTQTYQTTQTLSTTGGSGNGVVTYAIVPELTTAEATLDGNTLKADSGTGSVTIRAHKETGADGNYNPIDSPVFTITFEKANQDDLVVVADPTLTFQDTHILGTSGGSGTGNVSFYISAESAADVVILDTVHNELTAATGTGSVDVTAVKQADDNFTSVTSQPFTITLTKAAAALNFPILERTYDGTAKSATVTTDPTGLTINVTYDGGATQPINAGTYQLVATIDDPDYAGTETRDFVIAKAAATVTLGSLGCTYDGIAHAASATTSPTGMNVGVTYNGSTAAPTNAGSYAVVATVDNPNYAGSATGTLQIAKATATITLGSLSQTYSAGALAATATTSPAGLPVTFTYNGSSTVPTNAGSYAVVATINDPNYEGWATDTLQVAKATATVTLGGLNQTYSGGALAATATTSPAGLPVTFTYNGSSTAPTNAGSYAIVATVNDPNYAGSATGTLQITKATATVTLGSLSLNQTYNTAPRSVTATTNPGGLAVTLTYNGSSTAPTNAGSYAVVAMVTNANYEGEASGTLVIAKAEQASISFGASSPQTFGQSQTLSASGGSGSGALSYEIVSATPSGAGQVSGSVLKPNTGSGLVSVRAVKAGDSNYLLAVSNPVTVNFAKAAATVALSDLNLTYNGSPLWPTTTTTPAGLTVDLTFDSASTPPTNAGSYAVAAVINSNDYNGSANATFTIAPAAQTVALSGPSSVALGSPVTVTAAGAQNGYAWNSGSAGPTATYSFTPTTAGTHTVTVSSPAGGNYAAAPAATHTVTVEKATPVGTFAGRSVDAPYTLSAGHLNAVFAHPSNGFVTAPSSSAITYSPSAGTALAGGVHTVTATFAGDANYLPATASAEFVVNKATPTISWSPMPLAVGETVGGSQLNASASTDGDFSYLPGPGSVANKVGAMSLKAVFQPSDSGSYFAAEKVVSVNVTKTGQTINFPTPANKTFGNAAFFPFAEASSGLPVTFTVNSGPAALEGSAVKLTGTGTVSVTASQAGDATFDAAVSVTRSFTVGKANQTITFPNPFGASNHLAATASSGLPVSYAVNSSPTGSASIESGDVLLVTAPNANITITASQDGDANYNPATSVAHSFYSGVRGWIARPVTPALVSANPYRLLYNADTVQIGMNSAGEPKGLRFYGKNNTTSSGWIAISATQPLLRYDSSTDIKPVYGDLTFTSAGNWTVKLVVGSTMSTTTSSSPTVHQDSANAEFTVDVYSGQVITFNPPAYHSLDSGNLTLSATTTPSGQTVTFTVDSGPASVSGNTLSFSNSGVVTVTAHAAATSALAAAPDVTRQITIGRAPKLTVETSSLPADGTISVSGWALDYQDGAPLNVTLLYGPSAQSLTPLPGAVLTRSNRAEVLAAEQAAGLSPSVVALQSGWNLSLDPATLDPGTYPIYVKVVNSLGLTATQSVGSFTKTSVNLEPQTITFAGIPTKQPGAPTFPLQAVSTSNLPVTFSVVQGASLVTLTDGQLSVGSASGTVTIRASQPGNSTFAAAAFVDRTFVIGDNVDTDFDGMPDWWENQYGLNPQANDASTTGAHGLTHFEAYNLWVRPDDFVPTDVHATVHFDVRAKGTGTVTVTMPGDNTYTLRFTGNGNAWTKPVVSLIAGEVTSVPRSVERGKSYELQVSSSGVSDFILGDVPAPETTQALGGAVELLPSIDGTGSFVNQITKAELAALPTPNHLYFRFVDNRTAPFGLINTSQLETLRRVTFGLGESFGGQTGGLITLRLGRTYHSNDIAVSAVPGPALLWKLQTPLHTQLRVPAGYADITRSRDRIAITFYRDSSEPPGSGFKDFTSSTALASYELKTPSLTNLTLSRQIGSATDLMEMAYFNDADEVLATEIEDTQNGQIERKQVREDCSIQISPWRSAGAAKTGLTLIKLSKEVSYNTPLNGTVVQSGPSHSNSSGTVMQLSRFLGATVSSPLGFYEERRYGVGDDDLVGGVSIYRGAKPEGATLPPLVSRGYTETAYTENNTRLERQPFVLESATGGKVMTVRFSEPARVGGVSAGPSNLVFAPLLAIGATKYIRRSFLDYDLDPATDLITTHCYYPNPVDGGVALARTFTTQGGVEIGATTYAYSENATAHTVTTTITEYAGAGAGYKRTLKSYSRRLPDLALRGKLLSETRADNTQVSFGYDKGTLSGSTWNNTGGTYLRAVTVHGLVGSTVTTFSSGEGSAITLPALNLVDKVSTAEEKIFDAEGRLVRESTYVYSANSFSLLSSVYSGYDELGHLTRRSRGPASAPGAILYAASYEGLRKTSESDEQGVSSSFTYDAYGLVLTRSNAGASSGSLSVPATTTRFERDALGRVTDEIFGYGGPETLTTHYDYDLAGRVTSTTTPGGFETQTEYTDPTTTTIIKSDNGTIVSTVFKDGRPKSTTGTAVPDTSVAYAYLTGGNLQQVTTTGTQTTTATSDWLGRAATSTTATYDGGQKVVTNSYNASGQLETQTTTDGTTNLLPPTRFEYDGLGRLALQGFKSGPGTALNRSTDEGVVEYVSDFRQSTPAGATTEWYAYSAQKTYPYAGSRASTAKVASETYAQVSGLTEANAARVITVDGEGNNATATTAIDRAGQRTTVATTASSTSVTLTQIALAGQTVSSTDPQGKVTTVSYDGLRRVDHTTDPVIGDTDFTYEPNSPLRASMTTPDARTVVYSYDKGQRLSAESRAVDTADGLDISTTYYQYDFAGNLTHQWGSAVNPARFVYNDLGQRIAMYTYRDGAFDTEKFPASLSTGGDPTTWTYDPSTGLLLKKTDAPTPEHLMGKVTEFKYDDLSRISQRIDARRRVTDYKYDTVGRPSQVLYNQTDTADVTYTYDRAGKLTHVDDAIGRRDFSYYEAGGSDLEDSALLKSETLPGTFGSHVIQYGYQYGLSNRANGALNDLKLNSGSLYHAAYTYDAALRLDQLTYSNANGTVPTFTYTYEGNTRLIDKVSQGPSGYERDTDYEPDSYRVAKLKHRWGTSAARQFEARFDYNTIGQRQTEQTAGASYMATLGRSSELGVHIDYSYDRRLQLENSGKNVLSGAMTDAVWTVGAPLGLTNRAYGYDNMGNRGYKTEGAQTGTYSPNALNQYVGTPENLTVTYDDAGNQLNADTSTFTYDSEQRLRTVTNGADVWTYVYDYLGRRVEKKLNGLVQKKFVYDGWNLIAELDSAGTVTRTFVWGLDASGTLQGAGGVGGLLVIDDVGFASHFPVYDGSYNVIALYNHSGSVDTLSAYEYDPFGNVNGSGLYAEQNPFRFSTKYTDDETGLVYYGHRYYSPKLGRFINRDPIEETGGLNLYGFVGNDGVNRWDYLGNDDVFDRIRRTGGAGPSDGNDPFNTTIYYSGESGRSASSFNQKDREKAVARGQAEAEKVGLAPGVRVIVPITSNGKVVGYVQFNLVSKPVSNSEAADDSWPSPAKLRNELMSGPMFASSNPEHIENDLMGGGGGSGGSVGGPGLFSRRGVLFGRNGLLRGIFQSSPSQLTTTEAAESLGPGRFAPVRESMSARAANYQRRITGLPSGTGYVANGVKFDGFENGVLIDAKGEGYAKFVRDGQFQPWWRGADSLVAQAQRQLQAAGGAPIEWHFAEESAANATRGLFQSRGVSGVEILFTP